MSRLLPYGSENYLPREEIEYLDVEIRDMPPGIDVDVMYNSFSVAGDGKLYMGTCCTFGSSHILCYDPETDRISDIADMDDAIGDHRRGFDRQGKIHGRLFEWEGLLYGATHMDIATPVYGNYYDPKRYAGGHWFRMDPKTHKIEDLGIQRQGEGILTYTMDTGRGILYGVTWPSGYLYSFDVRSGLSRNLGRTSIHLSRFILSMSDGTVFYNMKDGMLGRYRFGDDCIESLPCGIPLCLSDIDWVWRKGVLQCAVEWDKDRSFIGFAGNPVLVSWDDDGICSTKQFPLFKSGIYSTFELAVSSDRKIFYSHCDWSEPYSFTGRLFRFDPADGRNEILGYMRCGDLHDIRHIAGGAISNDRRSLYYHALVPKDMTDRFDLTYEKLNAEGALFAKGLVDSIWLKKYFKPVLVICKV